MKGLSDWLYLVCYRIPPKQQSSLYPDFKKLDGQKYQKVFYIRNCPASCQSMLINKTRYPLKLTRTTTRKESFAIIRGSRSKLHIVIHENLLLFREEFHEFTYIPRMQPQTSLIINNARHQKVTTITHHVRILFCIIVGKIVDFLGVRLAPHIIADLSSRVLFEELYYVHRV